MSNRNNNQSLQNDSGQLNLVVRDEGTSNIHAHTRTLRFEPEGCLTFGPSGREVTINTESTVVTTVWEAGPSGTSSIQAKNSGTTEATGDYSVAHGENNTVSGDKGYVAGGSGNSSTHENSVILGGTSMASTATNTTYIGQHLEVGKGTFVGSIKRASATSIYAWEDGNCGNSDTLWFTPSDFQGYDIGGSRPNALTLTNTRVTTWGNLTGGSDGIGLWSQPTGLDPACQLVAMKLLPKGFVTGDDAVFHFADRPQWFAGVDDTDLQVFTTELDSNAYSLIGEAQALSANSTSVTLDPPSVATGKTAIVVCANQFGILKANQALLSVGVSIMRI